MTKDSGNQKGSTSNELTTAQPTETAKKSAGGTTAIKSVQKISPKLTVKLKSLLPTASKETLQTHSKWILFHSTRHERSICTSLLQTLLKSCNCENKDDTSGVSTVAQRLQQQQEKEKGVVYLTIVHEMLIMYNNKASEWNRHSSFRLRLGESVIIPFLERIVLDSTGSRSHRVTSDVLDSLKTIVGVWKKIDCFGGDDGSEILIDDILRLILQIDNIPTHTYIIGGDGGNDSSLPRNVHDTLVKDAATDIIQVDSKDADMPEKMRDTSSSTTQKSTSRRALSSPSVSPSSSPEKIKKESSKIDISNLEDANMNIQLTPTATDDDMFGVGDDDDDGFFGDSMEVDGEEKSPRKLASDVVDKLKKGSTKTLTRQASIQEKEFDFESEGIPHQKIEINQLQAPCKSIATVQITRDLHSDTAHSVSSLLSTVPDPVLIACRDALKQASTKGNDSENGKGVAPVIDLNELPSIPDPVLDLNLKQVLSNVRSHRDIIQKQKVARETLVNLLVKSRCQFGSTDTAELYYGLRETINRLQSCKSKVLDAMELEGLDREGIDDDGNAHGDGKEGSDEKGKEDALKDFEWFTREQAEGEKSSKRIRLE